MVEVLMGDLFQSKAQTLVNTVNCVGVMGKGIALEFKKRFPEMYEDYALRCKKGGVKLGQPYLYKRLLYPWILNFPTKDHWRSVARLQNIAAGFEYLLRHYKEWGITSLAVPPLGCGEGQLEWTVVGPTLYRYLKKFDILVELYAPYGTPPMQLSIDFLSQSPEMTVIGYSKSRFEPGWVGVVDILSRIESEPYHWPVGRTTFQKIAYFANVCGLLPELRFSQGSYGPYASNLKEKITRLTNNALIEEHKLGNMLNVKVGPTFKDAQASYSDFIKENVEAIEKIADLFLRMNTKQAEIASTVHFSTAKLLSDLCKKPTEKEVLQYVLNWKQRRKPPLSESEVADTIRHLAILGWIEVKGSSDLPSSEMVALEI